MLKYLFFTLVLIFAFTRTANAQIKITIPYYDVINQSAPANPSAGNTRIYVDTSNVVHTLSSAGTDSALLTTTGSAAGLSNVVNSFAGRTGTVVATSGDYTAAQVTNAVSTISTNTFADVAQTFRNAGITTTVTDSIILSNTTAALVGTKLQYSPALHYIAHHWNTADKVDDFRIYVKPTADSVVSSLVWESQYDGGGYTQRLSLDNAGNLTVGNNLSVTGTVNGGALSLASSFTTSGANALTLTTTGTTNVTLPTTGTLATLAGAETLSSKTLTAPKFASGGFIADANGNELLIFTTTASAINEITIANAATGNSPTITPTGGNTDIGLTINPKGLGSITITPHITTGGGTTGGIVVTDTTLTTGKLVDLSSNSTAGASGAPTVLAITLGGAHVASNITSYGIRNQNVHSGTGSVNVGEYISCSGGSANYALITNLGLVGIGILTPTAHLHVQQTADDSGTTNPLALNIDSVGAAGEMTASSSVQTFAQIAPVVNQSSTAGYTALKLNVTETATGSGAKLFQDWQVGGSSVISLTDAGVFSVLKTSAATATINTGGSQLILSSSGLTGNRTITFPDATATLLATTGDGSGLTNIVTSVNTRTGAVTGLLDVLNKVGSTSNTTADATEQTAYTYTLPASSLSSTGALNLMFLLYMRNGTGSTSTWIVKVKFGATTLITSPTLSGQGTGGSTLRGDIYIGATGGTSTQAFSGLLYWTAAADSTTAAATNTYQASNTSGLNLNNSNNVVVTVTETLATGAMHGNFNMRVADTIVVK